MYIVYVNYIVMIIIIITTMTMKAFGDDDDDDGGKGSDVNLKLGRCERQPSQSRKYSRAQ